MQVALSKEDTMEFTKWLLLPETRTLRDGSFVATIEQADGNLRRVRFAKDPAVRLEVEPNDEENE